VVFILIIDVLRSISQLWIPGKLLELILSERLFILIPDLLLLKLHCSTIYRASQDIYLLINRGVVVYVPF
jgi:hypothetical protein